MDDDLVHSFDDWELREDDDKGKRPVSDELQSEDEGPAREGGAGAGDGAEAGEEAAPPSSPRESEPGDMTCAICLHSIPLENLAMIKGCDHMYCATCILHWALHKEAPWCPQCKQPFRFLLTYRGVDGELQDFPCEEPVSLLKRTHWFEEHLRFADREAAAMLEESRLADQMAWQEYAGDYDLAEDEEIESFYFSSAAGRARVVLGNRRYGEGGYISGGRRQARPVPERRRAGKTGKAEQAGAAAGAAPGAAAVRTPNAGGGRKARPSAPLPTGGSRGDAPGTSPGAEAASPLFGSSPGTSSRIYGSSPSGSGRRARRNARRAAVDAGIEAAGG